ncbi:MAG: hypothetical protein IPK08_11715 [Bacteroidetes bacterium]|nr:hypothetical protein [Bacteroidota bacterium]
MTKNLLPEDDAESLRFENELLKIKLRAELGAKDVGNFPTHEVPPEVENEFLKTFEKVELFLRSAESHEEVSVYEFAGRPVYLSEKDLSDEQISTELNRLIELLIEKKNAFTVLSKISDRLIYKFVTEDLFKALTLKVPIPGMTTHFIYEEFQPINEYDTRRTCEDFMEAFFKNDFEGRGQFLPRELIRNLADLNNFFHSFENFRNLKYEVLDTDVTSTECVRTAKVSFDAFISSGVEPIHFAGEATFQMEYVDDDWVVISAMFPGMQE